MFSLPSLKPLPIVVFLSLAVVLPSPGSNNALAQDQLAKADSPVPDSPAARAERIKWWREAKFGMFIHWGLYAVPAGNWKQSLQQSGYSEWIMFGQKIPFKEYGQLAGRFNPVKFDAKAWVATAKNAGMKYVVLTTKHHEGFSMFKSRLTDYNIVDATPFKRDVTRELAEACRAEGLRFGCYYSIDRDWYRPTGPGNRYKQTNTWDFPHSKPSDFDRYFAAFAKPQIEELLVHYHPDILWFDGIDMMSDAQVNELYAMVRKLQPNCLVNSRIKGCAAADRVTTNCYDYVSLGDNEISDKVLPFAWENPGTTNTSYGYNQNDHDWVPPGELVTRLIDITSKGGNYLLNVGPTAQGVIPQPSIDRLSEVGKWMAVNHTAIYGTTPWSVFGEGPSLRTADAKDAVNASTGSVEIRFTKAERAVFAFCFVWPEKQLSIKSLGKRVLTDRKIVGVQMLGSTEEIRWNQNEASLSLSLPKEKPCPYAYVYRIDLE
jgi:alpha-L-fucosidase